MTQLTNIGVDIEVTFTENGSAVDISSATTKQIILTSPAGVKKTKTASFKTDGTDGVLTWTTIADDLDENGTWRVQGYVVMTGFTGYTKVGNFQVQGNL